MRGLHLNAVCTAFRIIILVRIFGKYLGPLELNLLLDSPMAHAVLSIDYILRTVDLENGLCTVLDG